MDEVRRKLGGTLNDVAVAVATGAMVRYFGERGISHNELAEMDVRVACPVNTRPREAADRSPADDLHGNHVSMMFAQLPVGERDPIARYERVRAALEEAKASHVASALESILDFGEWWPSALSRAVARSEMSRRTANLVLTNVPGPPMPLYLLGARLLESYPVVPLMPGQAVGIALLSYAGHLYFGFNAEWEALPELHDLVLATTAAFDELRGAALGVPATNGRAAARSEPRMTPRPC